MVGDFTQKRSLKSPSPFIRADGSFFRRASGNGGQSFVDLDDGSLQFAPRELTTSYRSGGQYGRVDDLTPQSILAENYRRNTRPYDNGHEFLNRKYRLHGNHTDYMMFGKDDTSYVNIFPLMPGNFIPGMVDLYQPGDMNVTKGSHALRATMPTKSAANLLQAILELVVDLPKIPFSAFSKATTFKKFVRASGEEYLNEVFAWSPLVSDVLKVCSAIVKCRDIIEQYERDSGRQVRRSYYYPEESTSTQAYSQEHVYMAGSLYGPGQFEDWFFKPGGSNGHSTVTDTTTEKYWFKGAWMYYADEGSTLIDKMVDAGNKANKVLGIKLTLSTLWELAPWSWLSDWFFNIGDIIAINSAIANDNLVLRYGYLMRTTHRKYTVTLDGIKPRFAPPIDTIRWTAEMVEKRRMRATPYGFGINTDAFSDAQWAILGALGLTKAPRKLWWG
jgi:hypothetical protein